MPEVTRGILWKDIAQEAIDYAVSENANVEFRFSRVNLIATPTSTVQSLWTEFEAKIDGK